MQEAIATANRIQVEEAAKSQEERLALADKAREQGDMHAAATLYLRLSRSRPATEHVTAARERFISLRTEADEELARVDGILASRNTKPAGESPSEAYGASYAATITQAFDEYHALILKFGNVSGIGSKVRAHVGKKRRTPEFAAILHEPEAHELFQLGRALELKGQACCAFHIYEEARKLRHAPSAKFAAERYDILRADPQMVAEAKSCAELQWCQTAYLKAEKALVTQPTLAIKVFESILKRAPEDSTVYQAASEKLGRPVDNR